MNWRSALLVALYCLSVTNIHARDWGNWNSLPSTEPSGQQEGLPPSLVEALADPEALREWVLENPAWAKQWAKTIDLDLAPLIGQEAWDVVLAETVEQLTQQDNVIQPIPPAVPSPPITVKPPANNSGGR